MVKFEKYLGDKTYMFPNGEVATPEIMQERFPAVLVFPHIIETDESGQVCFAVQNLSAMRSYHNIDGGLPEAEAIQQIEAIRNAPPPVPEPTAEERIASAMEFQNLMML